LKGPLSFKNQDIEGIMACQVKVLCDCHTSVAFSHQ
jgi:hypothetical protein